MGKIETRGAPCMRKGRGRGIVRPPNVTCCIFWTRCPVERPAAAVLVSERMPEVEVVVLYLCSTYIKTQNERDLFLTFAGVFFTFETVHTPWSVRRCFIAREGAECALPAKGCYISRFSFPDRNLLPKSQEKPPPEIGCGTRRKVTHF